MTLSTVSCSSPVPGSCSDNNPAHVNSSAPATDTQMEEDFVSTASQATELAAGSCFSQDGLEAVPVASRTGGSARTTPGQRSYRTGGGSARTTPGKRTNCSPVSQKHHSRLVQISRKLEEVLQKRGEGRQDHAPGVQQDGLLVPDRRSEDEAKQQVVHGLLQKIHRIEKGLQASQLVRSLDALEEAVKSRLVNQELANQVFNAEGHHDLHAHRSTSTNEDDDAVNRHQRGRDVELAATKTSAQEHRLDDGGQEKSRHNYGRQNHHHEVVVYGGKRKELEHLDHYLQQGTKQHPQYNDVTAAGGAGGAAQAGGSSSSSSSRYIGNCRGLAPPPDHLVQRPVCMIPGCGGGQQTNHARRTGRGAHHHQHQQQKQQLLQAVISDGEDQDLFSSSSVRTENKQEEKYYDDPYHGTAHYEDEELYSVYPPRTPKREHQVPEHVKNYIPPDLHDVRTTTSLSGRRVDKPTTLNTQPSSATTRAAPAFSPSDEAARLLAEAHAKYGKHGRRLFDEERDQSPVRAGRKMQKQSQQSQTRAANCDFYAQEHNSPGPRAAPPPVTIVVQQHHPRPSIVPASHYRRGQDENYEDMDRRSGPLSPATSSSSAGFTGRGGGVEQLHNHGAVTSSHEHQIHPVAGAQPYHIPVPNTVPGGPGGVGEHQQQRRGHEAHAVQHLATTAQQAQRRGLDEASLGLQRGRELPRGPYRSEIQDVDFCNEESQVEPGLVFQGRVVQQYQKRDPAHRSGDNNPHDLQSLQLRRPHQHEDTQENNLRGATTQQPLKRMTRTAARGNDLVQNDASYTPSSLQLPRKLSCPPRRELPPTYDLRDLRETKQRAAWNQDVCELPFSPTESYDHERRMSPGSYGPHDGALRMHPPQQEASISWTHNNSYSLPPPELQFVSSTQQGAACRMNSSSAAEEVASKNLFLQNSEFSGAASSSTTAATPPGRAGVIMSRVKNNYTPQQQLHQPPMYLNDPIYNDLRSTRKSLQSVRRGYVTSAAEEPQVVRPDLGSPVMDEDSSKTSRSVASLMQVNHAASKLSEQTQRHQPLRHQMLQEQYSSSPSRDFHPELRSRNDVVPVLSCRQMNDSPGGVEAFEDHKTSHTLFHARSSDEHEQRHLSNRGCEENKRQPKNQNVAPSRWSPGTSAALNNRAAEQHHPAGLDARRNPITPGRRDLARAGTRGSNTTPLHQILASIPRPLGIPRTSVPCGPVRSAAEGGRGFEEDKGDRIRDPGLVFD
ncbi:unnamed protein product [Amoebophrya sp. A120]|nr:unnamed protein product [Amoebophrya sp. A120]|eukprot:GSA120T00000264001.1